MTRPLPLIRIAATSLFVCGLALTPVGGASANPAKRAPTARSGGKRANLLKQRLAYVHGWVRGSHAEPAKGALGRRGAIKAPSPKPRDLAMIARLEGHFDSFVGGYVPDTYRGKIAIVMNEIPRGLELPHLVVGRLSDLPASEGRGALARRLVVGGNGELFVHTWDTREKTGELRRAEPKDLTDLPVHKIRAKIEAALDVLDGKGTSSITIVWAPEI